MVGFMIAAVALIVLPCFRAFADYQVIDSVTAREMGGALGGDEVRAVNNGDGTLDVIHLFTSTGTSMSFTVPAENTIKPGTFRMLIVGGGGSGGGGCGGGGGAGGLVYEEGLPIVIGTATASVGAGGIGARDSVGAKGQQTTFKYGATTYTALGGGGGGAWSSQAATAGGSSGGGSGDGAVAAESQTTSASGGYGNKGGSGASTGIGGGGGGAGEAGGAAGTTRGTGGAGKT